MSSIRLRSGRSKKNRSEAAIKGWETRRKHAREAELKRRARSRAAKRGWETRRENVRRAERDRRAEAARRGWETRRAREQQARERFAEAARGAEEHVRSWFEEKLTVPAPEYRVSKREAARALAEYYRTGDRDIYDKFRQFKRALYWKAFDKSAATGEAVGKVVVEDVAAVLFAMATEAGFHRHRVAAFANLS